MEFTNEQKLIITLLTDIHAKLEINDSFDPDFVQRMVMRGHGWALEWKYPGVFHESEDTPEAVTLVCGVLEMWSVLERSFEALDDNQRQALSEAAGAFGRDVRFPGFDGNNESEYLSIAHILVEDLDRWDEFAGRINNAHMRTIDGYQRMLPVFEEIRDRKLDSGDFTGLDVEELAQVLSERRHPENR
ncbi:YfbU family protein [Pseudomonas protegens]|uniref:YfbU family protein n=1 Tax=Pseudomonas protegens TaxID=380021 RepID=UPI0037F35FE6